MELGATVCVPNTEPKCGECPVSASCQAYKEVQRYAREGGITGAEGAPRCADYPAKVRLAAGPSTVGEWCLAWLGGWWSAAAVLVVGDGLQRQC